MLPAASALHVVDAGKSVYHASAISKERVIIVLSALVKEKLLRQCSGHPNLIHDQLSFILIHHVGAAYSPPSLHPIHR